MIRTALFFGFAVLSGPVLSAASISFNRDASVYLSAFDPTGVIQMPGFDPALGELTNVRLSATMITEESKISITTFRFQSVWDGTFEPRINILAPPGPIPPFPPALLSIQTRQPFSLDLRGKYGTFTLAVPQSSPVTEDAALCCDAFIGAGDLEFPVFIEGLRDLATPADILLRAVDGFASLNLSVTYDYGVSAPEPAPALLLGSALTLLAVWRKRSGRLP